MIKILNLKLVIMLEYQNKKTFLLKDIFHIDLKTFWRSKKVKNTLLWTYVINDLNGEEIIETFYEKELQKANKQGFRIEKVIKEKEINYMSNGKDMTIYLIAGFIKMILHKNESILHVTDTSFYLILHVLH